MSEFSPLPLPTSSVLGRKISLNFLGSINLVSILAHLSQSPNSIVLSLKNMLLNDVFTFMCTRFTYTCVFVPCPGLVPEEAKILWEESYRQL